MLCDDPKGKKMKNRRDMCIHIYIVDSFCCIAETNNIVKQIQW